MDTTVATTRTTTEPLGTLRIEVVAGPGTGLATLIDSDVITVGSADGNSLVLPDPTVSRFHLEVRRAQGILLVDLGSMNGTWLGATRIYRAELPPGSLVVIGSTTLRITDGRPTPIALLSEPDLSGLVGSSLVMQRAVTALHRAARGMASVLVVGESGTGKEVAARALHRLGPRPDAPFVTLDCASVAPTLLASEIFGHERGAFTGADRQHAGVFERGNGGTVFLDEIGELPPAMQASLLGVLERRSFRRVGGKTELAVDVRVLSATNRDLRAEVNSNSFRLDLYYRLAVVTLRLPPLRDRPEDIPLLVEHFMRELGHDGRAHDVFGADGLQALARQRWPGNVRELRNVVESALLMGLPELERPAPTAEAGALLSYKDARAQATAEFERAYVTRLLQMANGVVTHAARLGRMDRSHLIDLIHRHRLRED